MKNIPSILMAIALLCFIIDPVFGRSTVPPPPAYIGIGNAGDWIGSGPFFGSKTPYGDDFPDFFNEGGGNWGKEWVPSGGGVGGGNNGSIDPASCGCPGGRCITVNEARCRAKKSDFCETSCGCVVKAPKGTEKGAILKGVCMWQSSRRVYKGSCPNPQVSCWVRYHVDERW